MWLVFAGLVLGLLFLDLFVIHRRAQKVPFRQAMSMTAFWIGVSLAFGVLIGLVAGPGAAAEYLTAYLIEKSLSLDNVFVWAVIFGAFAVPEQYRYHVLFYGVLGAIVFRGIFVVAGAALLSTFSWLVYVFGALLVVTGLRMFRGGSQASDPQENRALRLFRRILPATEEYEGDDFIVRMDGKRYATPLLAVLVVIESTDVLFAVDSVPAVLSITQNPFLAYSSIVLAVLGLRALYFALEGLIDRFVYLHYGLAAILVGLGVKFVLQGFGVQLPIPASLAAITVIVTLSIVASFIATRTGASGAARTQGSAEDADRGERVEGEASSPGGPDGRAPASEATERSRDS